MVFCRQVNFFIVVQWLCVAISVILLASSCTIPKRYQKGKPFVYRSDITLNSELPPQAKQQLKEGLANQMDDSLKVRKVLAVRLIPPFFYYRLSKPPVFDTLYISRSKTFMTGLLTSKGYFGSSITDDFNIDTVREQQRVSVRFSVTPGKALLLDTVGYALQTPELQALALANREKSLLKKNDPYSLQNISDELDRLLKIYHDNGYYKIAKEHLYAEQDTVVSALIDPGLDPFEQLLLLDSLQRKKENPTISIIIKQRSPKDSAHLMQYHWGRIRVFPDHYLLRDSTAGDYDSSMIDGRYFFSQSSRFKLPFIARNITLREGALYKQSDYFKTINTFTNLGAWQQVDINLTERTDSAQLLDADILLFPAKKKSLNVDFETSRNTIDLLTTGSLFGIGLNLGMRDRNAFRESVQTTSNIRFGVELGPNFVQTVQASFAHNVYIPRFITPFKIRSEKNLTAPRTIVTFNTAYTNRRKFLEARSLNGSWGYDWSKKSNNWQYTLLNFEYTNVAKSDSLLNLEKVFPTLAQAFNNGLIIGQILAYSTGKAYGNRVNYFRAKFEESGAAFGLFKSLDRGDLRRFLKLDLEYRHFINFSKTSLAFRAFAGYGFIYGKTGDKPENNLPFFKAYFAGGPYSMRAWQVRQLGLGSSRAFDDTSRARTDRFGDMQLEGNMEYRFDLATIAGIKLKSAVFVDMGNIWGKAIDKEGDRMDSAEFKLSRLYKDLAVGGGASLRFDFDFFMIRLDWAYKLKDPLYAHIRDGWFHKLAIGSGQFQLGIGVPF
ncbi:MAG TPA: BamA/TamA family outer membrane protein [Flavitalea sp.]|nr:BamA/TamA family outer membrane protein [Flavitalea sp.]